MTLTATAKALKVPWTVCRGEPRVTYTETIFPPDFVADHGFILHKLWTDWNLTFELGKMLTKANSEIRALRGIIPICSFCKQVRDDRGYFEAVEAYLSKHSEADFSHTICPNCESACNNDPPLAIIGVQN